MTNLNRWAHRWLGRLAGAMCVLSLASTASAATLLDTGPPGGALGYTGFDIYDKQSVAVAFTPTQDFYFDNVSLWLMSNDNDPGRKLTISLQTNVVGGLAPSGTALESWNHSTAAAGWTPVLETLTSTSHTLLQAGTTYWITAESNEPEQLNPVWLWGGNGSTYTVANKEMVFNPFWQAFQTGGAPGVIVNAVPVPEPSTLLLGAVGAPLLLGIARRRKRVAQQA